MSFTMLVAAALAQAAPAITVEAPVADEVGFRALAADRPLDAIRQIDANRALGIDDPAALINLGTAHARLGDHAAAGDCYRSALVSRERYDLELADGTWMDSRAAARLALKKLAKGQPALALR